MKRLPAALLCGAVLAATLTTPARAADAAPAGLTIGWKDDTFTAVRVTWEDQGQANRVVLHRGGSPIPERVTLVPADAPNQLDIPARMFPGIDATQIGVSVGAAAGDTSPMTLSPKFDTDLPGTPVVLSSAISGGNGLTVRWKAGPTPVDSTPGDPLDRPASLGFQARYRPTGSSAPEVILGAPGPATQVSFTAGVPKFLFWVTELNEWGGSDSLSLNARTSAPTLQVVPGWSRYGDVVTVSGAISGSDARTVILQARNTPADPWYVVKTGSYNTEYFFGFVGPAPRQYRVQVPNVAAVDRVWFGGYSPVVTSAVQVRATAAFRAPTIRRGQLGAASLTVGPAADTTAVLQRWNGSAWTTVGPVAVRAGQGVGYVRGAAAGRVAYRYYVPATAHRGATYAATYSANFVLTTL